MIHLIQNAHTKKFDFIFLGRTVNKDLADSFPQGFNRKQGAYTTLRSIMKHCFDMLNDDCSILFQDDTFDKPRIYRLKLSGAPIQIASTALKPQRKYIPKGKKRRTNQ